MNGRANTEENGEYDMILTRKSSENCFARFLENTVGCWFTTKKMCPLEEADSFSTSAHCYNTRFLPAAYFNPVTEKHWGKTNNTDLSQTELPHSQ